MELGNVFVECQSLDLCPFSLTYWSDFLWMFVRSADIFRSNCNYWNFIFWKFVTRGTKTFSQLKKLKRK
ncbi:unnamed protein product [Caenorhabditis angaria]|uniref:Uncharacterized protein n=1 Tax=Caenorhabditis angaria TaxID=860376 RepID=A0A9P1N1T4_9PELO|nr:unnamed protein product [Caenorhabditis angaria]